MIGYINLVDKVGSTSRLRYELQEPTNAATAVAALGNIAVALSDVSSAAVTAAYVVVDVDVFGLGLNGVPVLFDSNLSEKAAMNLYLSAIKTTPLYIHAPLDSVFLAGTPVLDANNAAVQAYVSAVAASCFVSDGELVNTALGTGGIKNGHWVSTARRGKA